jgi:hypothetical protein
MTKDGSDDGYEPECIESDLRNMQLEGEPKSKTKEVKHQKG